MRRDSATARVISRAVLLFPAVCCSAHECDAALSRFVFVHQSGSFLVKSYVSNASLPVFIQLGMTLPHEMRVNPHEDVSQAEEVTNHSRKALMLPLETIIPEHSDGKHGVCRALCEGSPSIYLSNIAKNPAITNTPQIPTAKIHGQRALNGNELFEPRRRLIRAASTIAGESDR